MPDTFDPYFKWLGIPKTDQPPHGYRLLGIELYESDADVISNASDARMAQLKNYQTGKFAAISQKLLNEIAAAKVCLLNPQKKAQYDRRLRAHLDQKKTAAVEEPQVAVADGIAGLPFLDYAAAPTRSTTRPAKRANQSAWLIPVGLIGAAIVFAAGVSVYLSYFAGDKGKAPNPQSAAFAGGPRDPQAKGSAGSASKPSAGASETKLEVKPSGNVLVAAKENSNDSASMHNTSPAATSHQLKTEAAEASETTSSPEKSGREAAADAPDHAVAPPAVKKDPAKKPAAPDREQYQATKGKIFKIFQKELTEAKTTEAKLALAMKLDAQGDAAKDDPVERYALWRIAADGASAAGEFSLAMNIDDKLQDHFDVDGDAMKAELLNTGAVRSTLTPEAAHNLCEAALKLAAAAVAREDYDAAARFAKPATTAVRRAKDPQLSSEVLTRDHEIEHLKTRFAVVAKALETLKNDPDNVDANLAVGQWSCLVKGDWDNGLSYLAKGNREDLAALAKQDLAKPTGGKEQVALADHWWTMSEKDHGESKTVYQARAVHWYEVALASLTGLEKLRVEKQIATARQGPAAQSGGSSVGPKSFGSRGATQAGNVATIANGAAVSGVTTYPLKMLSPDDKAPTSYSTTPCEFIISLDKVYQLQRIRFLIQNGTTAAYQIAISHDGRRFDVMQDHRNEQMSGWQEFRFPAHPVKIIKLSAAAGTGNTFCVDRFEAYCFLGDGESGPRPGRRSGQ